MYGVKCTSAPVFSCEQPGACRKCVTTYKKTLITGWYGTFTLEAPPEAIELAWYCGVGSKNAAGFGFTAVL